MGAKKGSILIAGGGIAGVQAALDLADSGFYVYLVESKAAIGGRMSQLDKTFPTNDCSACILSPKLVECGRHLNIKLLTLSELTSLEGEPGNFKATVVQHPRYVDPQKCIACGLCAEKCPKKVTDEFNLGLNKRKAIYLTYPQAVPLKYAIDANHCIYLKKPGRCGFCAEVCPAGAINFEDKEIEHKLEVGSVILAPGFSAFDPSGLDFLGYKKFPNVVTSMEFERLLSPSGPCMGNLIRLSDHTEPKKIAWLQCIGSRDINRACHGYCSSVCCMYAIKQAVIAKEHAHGSLEASIFFMDMRTHGKEFEAYYNRAKEEGIKFYRSRVHTIFPSSNDNLLLRFSDEHGNLTEEEFDLVVLSVGLELDKKGLQLVSKLGIELDSDNFILTDPFQPTSTTQKGVFVCGAASEPKDIPQSVVEASAAALESEKLLHEARWQDTKEKQFPEERDISGEPPRIGVFVCHCGINIAGVIDVKEVTQYAKQLPGVVFAQDNLFTCSQDTINQMADIIRRERLNRVVVASCTPRTHEPLFQETLREAGINKYLFEMANIRDQDSWVHMNEPEKATQKAKDLVRMAVAKVRDDMPLPYNSVPVTKAALVIGGGVAGLTAALSLADQNFPVTLVEKGDSLGGNAKKLHTIWQGYEVAPYLKELISTVEKHNNITIFYNTTIKDVKGSVGSFTTLLTNGSEIQHGAAVIAIGAEPYKPNDYLYGQHPNVYTLLEMSQRFIKEPASLSGIKQALFIHCVGSRIPERPYCSRTCCTHAIDQALKLKKLNPDMDIFMLYRDIRTYGQREWLYHKARAAGIIFIRYDLDNLPNVTKDGKDISVTVYDPIIEQNITLNPDLLVLATAAVPRKDTGELSKFFKCAVNRDGFLLEAHMKLRPVDFATDGVFLAGLCHYPKPMDETIAQAQAAAKRAASILARDLIAAESITAEVNNSKCSKCLLCVKICPYNAISVSEETGIPVVDISSCKGCGACVAGCRSDAITLKNLDNLGIMEEVEALFVD